MNPIIVIFKRYFLFKGKGRKHINFNGLKAFIQNVKNTENQIALSKQMVDIRYKRMESYTAVEVIYI